MTKQTDKQNLLHRLQQTYLFREFRWGMRPRLALLLLFGLALLLSYGVFIRTFLDQRRAQADMATELSDARKLLSTAQPGLDREVSSLRKDLNAAQARLVSAQAVLPGEGQNVSLVDRILQSGTDSGVDITMLRAQEPVTKTVEGQSFDALSYQVRAEGQLKALMTFMSRLENELSPGAELTDTALHARGDHYRFDGRVYFLTSKLPQAKVPGPRPTPGNEERITSLRAAYETAMTSEDYELALSLLIRLKARQPDAADISKLFYDTYVAYGEALLAAGSPGLAEEQFVDALAIDPNGEKAVLGLLKVRAAITATPPVTPTPGPGGTPRPQVTPSPTLPVIVPHAATATATATAISTPTRAVVTPRPVRSPTRTRTRIPTVTRTATATVSPYDFVLSGEVSYLPNCGLTSIQGYVKDDKGRPMKGVRVKVWWDGAPADLPLAKASGTDPTKPSGYYDYTLASYPKKGQWYVEVFDEARGWAISPRLTVYTDINDCRDVGPGHQVVVINWKRTKGNVGQWQPTSTATRVGTSTRVPTYTPRPTYTPTVSPTPTLVPYMYPVDLPTGQEAIPDFPGGPKKSDVNVGDDFHVRDIRILVNITHDDIRDLVVTLVSPSSTRITLYQAGPNDTQRTEIRGWFTRTTTPALKDFIGQTSRGTWTLEVLDEVEGRTGELHSWTLELYP